jgi:hypothetical protein
MNTSQQISLWFLVTWRKLDLPISPIAVLSQEIPFEKRIRVLVISLQERQAIRQTPWHSGHTNAGANPHVSQMHQVRMYLKSTQGSPTLIFGVGKVDPFRSHPLDADKYEETDFLRDISHKISQSSLLTNTMRFCSINSISAKLLLCALDHRMYRLMHHSER